MLRRIFQFFRKSKSPKAMGVIVGRSPSGAAFEDMQINPDGSTYTLIFGSKVGKDADKPVVTIEHVEK